MKIQIHAVLFILTFATLFNCNQSSSKLASAYSINDNSKVAVQVTLEGRIHTITQNNLEPNLKSIFKTDSIFLEFWEDGNPLKLNFNLTNTDILETGTATYKIPEANAPKIKADLNFFIGDRDSKRMNKRIIFRKGIIEIKKLTNNELQMTFDGEGSGMMERGNSFPITGTIHVIY